MSKLSNEAENQSETEPKTDLEVEQLKQRLVTLLDECFNLWAKRRVGQGTGKKANEKFQAGLKLAQVFLGALDRSSGVKNALELKRKLNEIIAALPPEVAEKLGETPA